MKFQTESIKMNPTIHISSLCILLLMMCTKINGDLATNSIRRSDFDLKTAQTPYQLIESLRKQVLEKENELKKAEEINKNFEKMIQLVNILGQVDSFLTERTRAMIQKLAMLTGADNGEFEKEYNKKHPFK
ncbi:unnamed protein product [Phyllotreta striolata]|uniref:Uncharacterized protein n=1 Tax=Phyllotreta striolata TaxID=444603 RepID=A0A9N9TF23_PHYSR|nr:unnamed protein product [Phyllotreta striolata]